MLMACRHLKSPQSLYGTSTYPTIVTHRSWSWSWMIDSHPFRSMSPITQIRLFQTLTLKLQGHSRARSYSQPSILIHLLSFCFTSDNNSRDTAILKLVLEKSKVKVMGEVKGHIVHPVSNRCTSFSFHINRTNHSCDMSNSSLVQSQSW